MIPLIGCIADDYTGATDLASMLVRGGLRVVQLFGIDSPGLVGDGPPAGALRDVNAVVVALKSRSIAAREAVDKSLRALDFLRSLGIEQFFFKYCSTFDSTRHGNIGPVADALAEVLNVSRVVFCPAFPENGRTVYRGHLFVGDQLLSESSLRHHPLHPMTDSNLVRVLQAQSRRPVGRWTTPTVAEDPFDARLSDQRLVAEHLIADATCDADLRAIARVCRADRLLTGGSAIARYWGEEILANVDRSSGAYSKLGVPAWSQGFPSESNDNASPLAVVLAGSCSEATRGQIAAFRKQSPVLDLPLRGNSVTDDAAAAVAWCDRQWGAEPQQRPLLITCSASDDQVESLRSCLGEAEAARYAEQTLGRIAVELVKRGVASLVVAGGETSGAVIQSLKITAIRIGRELSPGVPVVYPLDRPGLALVLKSGNFGGKDFFSEALAMMEAEGRT